MMWQLGDCAGVPHSCQHWGCFKSWLDCTCHTLFGCEDERSGTCMDFYPLRTCIGRCWVAKRAFAENLQGHVTEAVWSKLQGVMGVSMLQLQHRCSSPVTFTAEKIVPAHTGGHVVDTPGSAQDWCAQWPRRPCYLCSKLSFKLSLSSTPGHLVRVMSMCPVSMQTDESPCLRCQKG
jgi:hypothetical protein